MPPKRHTSDFWKILPRPDSGLDDEGKPLSGSTSVRPPKERISAFREILPPADGAVGGMGNPLAGPSSLPERGRALAAIDEEPRRERESAPSPERARGRPRLKLKNTKHVQDKDDATAVMSQDLQEAFDDILLFLPPSPSNDDLDDILMPPTPRGTSPLSKGLKEARDRVDRILMPPPPTPRKRKPRDSGKLVKVKATIIEPTPKASINFTPQKIDFEVQRWHTKPFFLEALEIAFDRRWGEYPLGEGELQYKWTLVVSMDDGEEMLIWHDDEPDEEEGAVQVGDFLKDGSWGPLLVEATKADKEIEDVPKESAEGKEMESAAYGAEESAEISDEEGVGAEERAAIKAAIEESLRMTDEKTSKPEELVAGRSKDADGK